MSLPPKIRSVTLLELLTAVVLITIIISGITSIEVFSRFHVLGSDRKARLQNEASVALEHMSKHISQAIGNTVNDRAVRGYADNKGIRIRIDSDGNGRADTTDTWIAYRHENIGSPATDSEIGFYPNAGNTETPAGSYESIARRVVVSTPSFSGLEFLGNFNNQRWLLDRTIEVKVTCRWDPVSGSPASVDNPEVTMRTRIEMPSMSGS